MVRTSDNMITYDNLTYSGDLINISSWNGALAIANQPNRIIIVCTHVEMGGGVNRSVSSITYNGVGLTKIHDYYDTDANDTRVEIWYLVAPATGSNSIVVTWSGNVNRGRVFAISYYGVHQASPVNASQEESDTATSPSISVTPTVFDTIILAFYGISNVDAVVNSVGAGQTLRHSSVGSAFRTAYTDKTQKAPSASASVVNLSQSSPTPMIAVALRPYPTGRAGIMAIM